MMARLATLFCGLCLTAMPAAAFTTCGIDTTDYDIEFMNHDAHPVPLRQWIATVEKSGARVKICKEKGKTFVVSTGRERMVRYFAE